MERESWLRSSRRRLRRSDPFRTRQATEDALRPDAEEETMRELTTTRLC